MTTIHTPRLTLRPWQMSDFDDFYEYAKHPDVGTHAGWKPHESREESAEILVKFIESDDVWAIELKENSKVIGQLKIYPDENRGKFSESNSAKLINYALSKEYWGLGYATEAVKCAVKYLFEEMETEILTAFHFPNNNGSKRVIEKCGFSYECTIAQGYKNYNGQIYDSVCHSMLKSEYEQLKQNGGFTP